MLAAIVQSLPLGTVDTIFARGLSWLCPKINGHACQAGCFSLTQCGTCQCPGTPSWCTVTHWCDACNGADCGCDYSSCPPPGPLC